MKTSSKKTKGKVLRSKGRSKASGRKWNKKISLARKPSWKKKMVAGKVKYAKNPSQLRKARVKADLSQEVMAARTKLTFTTYGDVERGKRLVRPETADMIARVVKRKREALFKRVGDVKFVARR